MSVGIECPVCEAVFRVKQVSTKTGIRCPKCDRKFRYSEDILASPQPNKTSSLKTKTSSLKTKPRTLPATDDSTATSQKPPKQQDHLKKKSKSKPASVSIAASAQEESDASQAANSSTVDLKKYSESLTTSQSLSQIDEEQAEPSALLKIEAWRVQKARRQTLTAVASIVILSIATIFLGVLLYQQLNSPPPAEETIAQTTAPSTKTKPIDPFQLNPDLSEPQWRGPAENSSGAYDAIEPDDLDEEPSELPRVAAGDLPKREFEYLQIKEMRSVWQRIRPRLVSLDARTDLGASPSVGTIVDSRGWALTSNQFVGKWPDVVATASARDIDDYYTYIDTKKESGESSLLTDLSKGIASVEPKRDQTLIELNSRFVVALDTIEFATRLDIVAGMYLVQAAPPSPTNPYGYEEVEVHGRQEFEELETEARDKATALGIDDPLATWVVTSKKASPVAGTPVLTKTGKLTGTYVFSTKQFAYFLMADKTKNLIAQAAAASADGGKLKVVDATIDLLSPDHTMARPSQLMNRAGVACESFDWIPADKDQYLQLQKFSRRFSTVAKFVQDQQDDESESVTLSILSDHIKRWQRSISKSIRDANRVSPEKVDRLNAIAVEKLSAGKPNNANTYIPFVSEVYSAGYDVRDNQYYVLMIIGDDQAIIKAPYSPENGAMRPGSQWLCFYKRPRDLRLGHLKLNSGEVAPAYGDGKILLVLGPIKKQ